MKEASIQMIDRAGVHLVLQLSHFSLSLIAFSVMASAETSHHTQYHYSFYPSLTFFVTVGVASFLFSIVVALAHYGGLVSEETRTPLELYGCGIMLWLTYTAAVAAAATSSDVHSTFDEFLGSVCKPRHSANLSLAGGFFCGRLVAATSFMFLLCFSYLAALVLLLSNTSGDSGDGDGGGGGGYSMANFGRSSSYNEIDGADAAQIKI